MDRNRVGGLVEKHPVTADTKPQQPRQRSAERLDSAYSAFSVTVHGLQNGHGGALVDRAHLRRHAGLEADSLHQGSSVALMRAAELVHGETALGHHLLERKTLAALAEVLS